MERINGVLWNSRALEYVYLSIEEFSDIEFQKTVWSGKDPSRFSAYTEAICKLFDDSFFDNFIEDFVPTRKDLSEVFIRKVWIFREQLNVFNDSEEMRDFDCSKESNNRLFRNPKWLEIVELAKEVKGLWEESVLYELMHKPEDDGGG